MIKKLLERLKGHLSVNQYVDKKEINILTERIKTEIGQFKIVFDVGAYQGKFIDDILHLNSEISFHCFEPSFDAYHLLKKKYQQTHNVEINHCAVSDFSGTGILNINAFKETNSLLESIPVHNTIDSLTQKQSIENVEIIKLSEYCLRNNIHSIDLIKIDTQGNSYNVLSGLESFLIEKKVRFLYVEAEFIEIYKDEKLFSEIEILMRSYGYSIVDLFNLNYIDTERLAWCDVLFAPH